MGLFGNAEEKAKKAEMKEQELLQKYGLEDISEKDIESVKKILADLQGNGLIKAGMALAMADASEQAKIGYLSASVEQNWIMIRQLDRIEKLLSK